MGLIHIDLFTTLDGVAQAPGGPEEDPSGGFEFGGWTQPFWDESANEPIGKLFDADYDLLLAKRTYDIFAAYWPYNQDVPIGAKFQRINKYVLTHSTEPLKWDGSQKLCCGEKNFIGKRWIDKQYKAAEREQELARKRLWPDA